MTKTLQIRLGYHRPTPEDSLNRPHVGAYPGIPPEAAWEAARGVWSLNATRVLDQDEVVVIDPEGTILATATINGVYRAPAPEEGKQVIDGTLIPNDPRVGTPTPALNPARNSIHYR